jgi:uncharacterized protein with GYD domain
MSKFILLTRMSPGVISSPESVEILERRVMEQVRTECRGVEWLSSYATIGPYDYVDVFGAPDIETATKVAFIVRMVADAHTEVWPATDWPRFVDIVHELPLPGGP